MICSCKCGNDATNRVTGFLTEIQKQMLGYFCKSCIKKSCTDNCLVGKPNDKLQN